MYVKSTKRIISDNDLVKVRCVILNENNDDEDNDIEIYHELSFTHGYTNELGDDIPLVIKNNLDKIIDRYSTVNVLLEASDVDSLKLPDIKPGSNLQINVVDAMAFDFKWNLSEDEKISIVQILKDRGNYKAQLKLWSDAFRNYHRGVKYLRDSVCVLDQSHQRHDGAEALLIGCMNNAAIACLKLGSGYLLCVKYCDHILSIDNRNTKALYRRAKAQLHLKNYESALDSIDRCLSLETDDKARKEIAELKSRCCSMHRIQQEKDKELCQDIFVKMGDLARKAPDDNKSSIPYDIVGWDNSMADKMISITEELEAFGEEMPPRISINPRNGESCTIIEEEDDFE